MHIIVGSTALKQYNLNRREPVDLDVWGDSEEALASFKGDLVVKPLELLNLVQTNSEGYATPDSIYTIKLSHAVYDIHWDKTKLDILWLKAKGCKVIPELYAYLQEHWKIEHGNKDFLSLNKTKDSFFDDNVTYVYDHDFLHQLVAYPNLPMYTHVLKDGQEVLIDKEKFFKLPFEQQVQMFREEITVIAAERWMINPRWRGKVSWYKAYMMALRKTVTTLTKGYASAFIVENLEHFVKPKYLPFKHLIETLGLEK